MNINEKEIQDELEREYFRRIEAEWLKTLPRFTDQYLFETFGDSIDSFNDKILSLKKGITKTLKKIDYYNKKYVKGEDIDSLFAKFCIEHFLVNPLKGLEKSYFLLLRLKHRKYPPKIRNPNSITESDIERCRQVSLVRLAEDNGIILRKNGKTYSTQCPFHEERTPSFYIYEDSNRFHCFGCGKSGDIIHFIESKYGFDFITTIKFLINK